MISKIIAWIIIGALIALGLLMVVGGPIFVAADYFGGWLAGIEIYLAVVAVLFVFCVVCVWALNEVDL